MGKNSLNIYPVKLSYDEVDTIKDWKRKYLSETNGTIESAVISNVLEQIVNAFSEVIEIDTDEDTGQKVITVLFPDNRDGEEKKECIEFAGSLRGTYLISQALNIAITVLDNVKAPYREISNMTDMRYLRHYLFNLYPEFGSGEEKRYNI